LRCQGSGARRGRAGPHPEQRRRQTSATSRQSLPARRGSSPTIRPLKAGRAEGPR
jgi:hypothetical protein